MKRLIAVLIVFIGGMVLTTTAAADDVDDVKAAVQALYETLNKGDADGYAKLVLPGESLFLAAGRDRHGRPAAGLDRRRPGH